MNIRDYIVLKNKPNQCKEDLILIEDYNKGLIEKYPYLKLDDTHVYTWLDNIPDGWRLIFEKSFLKDLSELIKDNDFEYGYKIIEIGKSQEGLIFYDNTDFTSELIDKYNNVFLNYCEICGTTPAKFVESVSEYLCEHCEENVTYNGEINE